MIEATKSTGRKLPRPLAQNNDTMRPVPWSQGEHWGTLNEGRQRIAEQQSRCLVCGETVKEGIVFLKTDKADSVLSGASTYDPIKDVYDINDVGGPGLTRVVEGALHAGCALLTRSHCKTVRQRLSNGVYVERPYKRGRYKPGNKPKIPYR